MATVEGTVVKEKTKARNKVHVAPDPAAAPLVVAQTVTPMQLVKLAVEQGADMDRLGKLLDLQLRWEQNEARKAFVHAMAAFKADPPTILKNKDVAFGNTAYSHATLDQVASLIGAAMSKHGLSFRWKTAQTDRITVTCIVTHELGHSEEVSLSGAPDNSGGKNAIQAVGSTVSYLERYTLLAATGLAASDQDDDGHGAGERKDDNGKRDEPPGLPAYTAANFEANLPAWQKLIDGGRDPERIITTVSTKYALTADQLEKIRALKKVAA